MQCRYGRSLILFSLPLLLNALSLDEAIKQGALQGSAKLYYYGIDKKEAADSHATSLGGSMQYTTATWNDLFARAGVHTSNAIGSRENPASTYLFNNDNDGRAFTVLSESFIGYRRNQRVLKAGNFRLNTPMMNDDTTRIVPWSYRGIAFTSTPRGGVRLQLNHITHMRSYVSDQYTKESASGHIDNGITMLGIHYDPIQELSLFGFYYRAPHLYDSIVLQSDYKHPLSESLMFCTGLQYFKSTNGGEYAVTESASGGDDIDLIAWRLSAETDHWDIGVNYSRNFGLSGIVKGYGGSAKVYTTSMIANGRGNYQPETWMFNLQYDFPSFAWGNSDIALRYTDTDVHDSRGNAFNAYYLHWRHYFNSDTSLYARYERMDYENATPDGEYLRIIATYEF